MALGPISPAPVPPPQSAHARDMSSAQRAFFQAALERVQAAAQPAPAATSPAAPSPAHSEPKPERAAESTGGYRPGKLLDIRV